MRIAIVAVLAAVAVLSRPAQAQPPGEVLRQHLETGRAKEAAQLLTAAPGAEAVFARGIAEFFVGLERLLQGLHRHGLQTPGNPFLPFLRLPVPANPRPEPLDYAKMRAIYQVFLDDQERTRSVLAQIGSTEAKVPLDLFAIRLRISPQAGEPEVLSLKDVIAVLSPAPPRADERWEVVFDNADAHWLVGYTHLLSAVLEFILAHDWQPTYAATAHLFFAGAKPPTDMLASEMLGPVPGASGLADQIAFLHLVQWPAGDRRRMEAVRAHLKSMIGSSRRTFAAVQAETDDDREWLPSPRQTSRAVPGRPIDDGMVGAWLAFLDEFEALLDGKVLLGHWRFNKGVDLRLFFTEPRPFDLVLWLTGHGARPFLKDGPTLSMTQWGLWNQAFRGNFLGYMFFIN